MVDLDSNPTKLIEVVETGKQMLMTRGALTTFSIANDIAKYFAIIPAAFVATYPQLSALNVMQLASPNSAILSAVIFNALIIIFLIPLALKGVKLPRAWVSAAVLLRRNLAIYGLGGVVVPFIGIKADRSGDYRRRLLPEPPQGNTMKTTPEITSVEPDDQSPLLRPALVLFAVLTPAHRPAVPAAGHGRRADGGSTPGQRQPDPARRPGGGLRTLIGQPFSRAGPLLEPPFSDRAHALQRSAASSGSNLGPSHPALAEACAGAHRGLARGRPRQHRPGAGRPGHGLRQRSGPAHQPGRCALPGGAGGACARSAGRTGERPGGPPHRGRLARLHWGKRG